MADAEAQLRVVGTSVGREIDALLAAVGAACGATRPVRALQVGARVAPMSKADRNWRHVLEARFGKRLRYTGLDIEAGVNVDVVHDVCDEPAAVDRALGGARFDLVVCEHVLEHVRAPWRAAAAIQSVMAPGGHALIAVPWSHAHHPRPDDFWRMSFAGVAVLFDALEPVELYYTGNAVGLDIAYRVTRDGRVEMSPAIGAVEQGLFQLTLDHEENKALLSRQPGQRVPLSRVYLPAMVVNVVARKPKASGAKAAS
ncbi:MAG: methyltransferase domain-containing protein [Rhodospirillales bacterium]|nr:MAG: methyltransferase domain-containing protein [Rhodospirillales bacterium]